ncbi:intradiol ring-cleavage dioxygenase [Methylobacterium sp. J-068]|uniref:intradiol ring-cleavage dioxygenase n=1 Tax=Methylobacterium sp. J-068 TaxID=2836649 RepID=UPI001FBAF58C|nr:intradiol ring-cleavage dioxygenase [Methylobacterium sp. J-068]MCJ2033607.1 intradiol ring-cleavage dioxygenase [Methylobacterium sp. J-068]
MSFRAVLSRRAALLGLTGSLAASHRARADATPSPLAEGVCRLMPQTVEGPFYLDPKLVRDDIREDRPGLPLTLRLRVIEAGPCTPVPHARVDVWHADARGIYSGYRRQGDTGGLSTEGQTFLRGTQTSDAEGWVAFRTIYPGWYPGRATHVHFKVFLDARTLVTGQMYFPEPATAAVYRDAAYGNRAAARDTLNAQDGIARHDDPAGIGLCTLAEDQTGRIASLIVGIDRKGPPKAGWWRF